MIWWNWLKIFSLLLCSWKLLCKQKCTTFWLYLNFPLNFWGKITVFRQLYIRVKCQKLSYLLYKYWLQLSILFVFGVAFFNAECLSYLEGRASQKRCKTTSLFFPSEEGMIYSKQHILENLHGLSDYNADSFWLKRVGKHPLFCACVFVFSASPKENGGSAPGFWLQEEKTGQAPWWRASPSAGEIWWIKRNCWVKHVQPSGDGCEISLIYALSWILTTKERCLFSSEGNLKQSRTWKPL